MLDAYIIERIRREREQARQKDNRIPLYIDDRPQRPEPRPPKEEDDGKSDRGSVIIA